MILRTAGRTIEPEDRKKEESGSMIQIMEQYYDVRLGTMPQFVKEGCSLPSTSRGEHSEVAGNEPEAKRAKISEGTDKRLDKWLLKNTSINKLLILIPDRGLIAESIMRSAHNISGHGGINYTMRIVNQEFNIVKPTKLYNHVRKTCFMCRFFTNKLWQVQEGLLPRNKIIRTYPFQFVGIDIAGPLFRIVPNSVAEVRKRHKKSGGIPAGDGRTFEAVTPKYYVLLIVCANTRAVDLQLVNSLSAESILQAFETFVHNRGRPTYVLSDNADNFEKANKVFQESLHKVIARNYPDIRWQFIPTYSPWWGGQYEVFVKLTKTVLRKQLPSMKVRGELHAVQLLKSAEACLNSRPLYAVSKDVNDVEVITPQHFLRVGHSLPAKYQPANIDLHLKILRNIGSEQCAQVKALWVAIHQIYLTQLRKFFTKHGCFSKRPIKIGDIVLIMNDAYARNFWPIAIVVAIFPSKDGIIRQVMLKKYLPSTINSRLRNEGYGKSNNVKLTNQQIRELMGFFEEQRRKTDVRNLVPYELWKGDQAEPEDMDDGSHGVISINLQGETLQGSEQAFIAMGIYDKPQSEAHTFEDLPQHLRLHEPETWKEAGLASTIDWELL